jgi:hypothetical protein
MKAAKKQKSETQKKKQHRRRTTIKRPGAFCFLSAFLVSKINHINQQHSQV